MVTRFMGSTTSIRGIKSLAPGDKWLGNVYIPPYRTKREKKRLQSKGDTKNKIKNSSISSNRRKRRSNRMYLYLLKKVGNVFIIKWKRPTEKSVEYHTTAPDIYFRASI